MSEPAKPLVLALTFLCLGILPAAAQAAPCPNEALREAQTSEAMPEGSVALPGCMALELASPPQKFSQPAFLPSFSLNGERLQFKSEAALSETPGYQRFSGDPYVASRGASGWTTASTSPPSEAMIFAGGNGFGSPEIFAADLGDWAQIGANEPQSQVGIAQLFRGGLDGSFAPLSPLLVPIEESGSNQLEDVAFFLELDGASADLSTSVLHSAFSATSYFPKDPRGTSPTNEPGGDHNSYVVFPEGGEPALELLARDNDGTVYGGRCGAHIGGPGATFNQGAISADGSRIYFSTRPAQPFDSETGKGPVCDTANPVRILKRTATAEGPAITEIAPGAPAEAGDDLFQAASADGTKVYFTSPRKLSASDTDTSTEECGPEVGKSKGCDLYLYDSTKPPSERLSQVSAGEEVPGKHEAGKGADVLSGITAISRDGSHVYYVAQGVLSADQNPEGATAQAGQPNLYLYDAETAQTSFIGSLASADQGAMWGTGGSFFGEAYATPDVLAFASKAPLTADDEDGGHRDVFRYDADSETLQRISKAVPGGEDNGPFDATVNPASLIAGVIEYNFNEKTRWVSEDGQTIAFATQEALLPEDQDEASNPYVWDSGRLGAAFAAIDEPPAVSPPGGQIAFSTPTPLLPQDGDTAEDVYVARAGGGFPNPAKPTECDPLQEGSCQTGTAPPQAPPPPASASFSGPGNPSGPAKCKKGFARRNARCVKKQRKHGAKQRTGHKRGGRR